MKATATKLENRQRLALRMAESRAVTDDLFQRVIPAALYDRPIPERHRIIFYIGHLEAFDWNLIAGQALGMRSSHQDFDRLFAFGIDPVGGGLPQDQPSDWPATSEVESYNRDVRQKLDEILCAGPPASASSWQYPPDVVLNVAIEHRLMHAETLAYMLHQLPFERKIAPPNHHDASSEIGSPIAARMIDIPAGPVTLGISPDSFGWDNEFKVHSVQVPAFAIDAYKVTNGEFLKFIREGGYANRSLWGEAEWDWIKQQNIAHPRFWRKRQSQWFYQGMFEEVPLPPNWPVYVSHAEASAYARFVGKALPTEAQFHRAAYGTAEGVERIYPWGEAAPHVESGNFDFHRWDPAPVDSHPGGRSAFGVEDMLGNGWEWTSTLFAPFPGFEPFPVLSRIFRELF